MRAFTPEEIAALLAHADPSTVLLIEMGASSGLRESELFGIRLEDIDFQRGGVNVSRQLQNGTVLAPKTEKSRRFVPLAPAIMKKLWEHPRRSCGGLEPPMPKYFFGTRSEPDLKASREALDEAFRSRKLSRAALDEDLLLLQRWQRVIETRHERGKITFHSLRHSTATAAIASGANVQTVSSLLGHANPQVTLTTYADQWAARLDQATAVDIAGILFGSKMVAEGKKAPATELDSTEESAVNSEL